MQLDRQPSQRQRILIAPTAYKGTLSAIDAAMVIAETLQQQNLASFMDLECVILPLTDGGTDTLACLLAIDVTGKRWQTHTQVVMGPLPIQQVKAMYLIEQTDCSKRSIPERQIIIEAAQAHGMANLPKNENRLPILSPLQSTSYGVGELIQSLASNFQTADILDKHHLVITLGGSASTDAGAGALQALGWQFYSKSSLLSQPLGGEDLSQITEIIPPTLTAKSQIFSFSKISILTDVTNPLLGPLGTVPVFSPQKGAKPEDQELLEAGIQHFQNLMYKTTQLDFSEVAGSGAAGGLAYALMHHASWLGIPYVIQSGFEWYGHLVDLTAQITQADWIISGEGSLDSQSFGGKSVGSLIQQIQALEATGYQKKLVLFCGKMDLDKMDLEMIDQAQLDILKPIGVGEKRAVYLYTLEDLQNGQAEAMSHPDRVLKRAVQQWFDIVFLRNASS